VIDRGIDADESNVEFADEEVVHRGGLRFEKPVSPASMLLPPDMETPFSNPLVRRYRGIQERNKTPLECANKRASVMSRTNSVISRANVLSGILTPSIVSDMAFSLAYAAVT
jgi:hypothetical protein